MMKSPLIRFAFVSGTLLMTSFVDTPVDAADYPETPKRPVIERYHGVDERVGVENYGEFIRFYMRYLREAAGG